MDVLALLLFVGAMVVAVGVAYLVNRRIVVDHGIDWPSAEETEKWNKSEREAVTARLNALRDPSETGSTWEVSLGKKTPLGGVAGKGKLRRKEA